MLVQWILIILSVPMGLAALVAIYHAYKERWGSDPSERPSETPTLDALKKYMTVAIEEILKNENQKKDKRNDNTVAIDRVYLEDRTIMAHNSGESKDYYTPKNKNSRLYKEMEERFGKAIYDLREMGLLTYTEDDHESILIGVPVGDKRLVDEPSPSGFREGRVTESTKGSASLAKKSSRKAMEPEQRVKWQKHISNFGFDYAEDRRRQMQSVARRWLEYAHINDFNAGNSDPKLVQEFLDTLDISQATYNSYKSILDKWFEAVEAADGISVDHSLSDHSSRQKAKKSLVQRNQQAKIIGYSYLGQVYQCNSAKETLVRILQHFQSEDPQFLERLSEKSRSGRSDRVLVSKDRLDLYPNTFKARNRDYGELGNGWWVSTNRSRNDIFRQIELACIVRNVKFGEDLEVLTQ